MLGRDARSSSSSVEIGDWQKETEGTQRARTKDDGRRTQDEHSMSMLHCRLCLPDEQLLARLLASPSLGSQELTATI